MKTDVLAQLFAMLPEGPKKETLRQKMAQATTKTKKRGGNGLEDLFEFQPKGHIKMEAIDAQGNVVGVLADQDNLVVQGAEEILLRAFSGDPNRVLYKNRVPKAVSGKTGKIYVSETKLGGANLLEGNQLLHAPNVLWSEVNDDDFDLSYGFYPVTVFVKEEVSTEVGKKAFSIAKQAGAGLVPMSAEIYSTYTNLFIGIGEGENVLVDFNDRRFTKSEGVSVDDGQLVATTELQEISFKEKISNFRLEVEASKTGAQIDVFIGEELKETIESFDSLLEEPEVRVYEYKGLDHETETSVRIVHSGGDEEAGEAKMKLTGLSMDALTTSMNGLIKEFANFETNFTTPASFNTTPMAPYTIQLPHFPVKKESIQLTYEGEAFTKVDAVESLANTTFMVDDIHGTLTFNRALTGVLVSYSSTGELFDTEMIQTMTSTTVTVQTPTDVVVAGEKPTGSINGVNMTYTLAFVPKDETIVVKVDGEPTEDFSLNAINKKITLNTALSIGKVLTVDYTHVIKVEKKPAAHRYTLDFPPTPSSVVLVDQAEETFSLVTDANEFKNGTFMIDVSNPKQVILAANNASGEAVTRVEIRYLSSERPGVPTNYTRAIIEKPKSINEYPWFELDKGAVRFVAEFPELKPAHNITIREMGLFDGPRTDDHIAGFKNYPVKAFSLVRVGEARKEMNTGIRITWTITLLNAEGEAFKGGFN